MKEKPINIEVEKKKDLSIADLFVDDEVCRQIDALLDEDPEDNAIRKACADATTAAAAHTDTGSANNAAAPADVVWLPVSPEPEDADLAGAVVAVAEPVSGVPKPVAADLSPSWRPHGRGSAPRPQRGHTRIWILILTPALIALLLAGFWYMLTDDNRVVRQPVPAATVIESFPIQAPGFESTTVGPPVAAPLPTAGSAGVVSDTAAPLVATFLAPKPEGNSVDGKEAGIHRFLERWRQDWERSAGESGDMAAFSTHYGAEFRSAKTDRQNWLQNKNDINRRKQWIRIRLSDVRIQTLADGQAVIRFRQDYRSSNYDDITHQALRLKKQDGAWKIAALLPPDADKGPQVDARPLNQE